MRKDPLTNLLQAQHRVQYHPKSQDGDLLDNSLHFPIVQIMERLLNFASEHTHKLIFIDEAVFATNTFSGKAWWLENYLVHLKSINQQEFIVFFEQLTAKSHSEDFSIFMNNLMVHKSRAVKDAYERLNIIPICNITYSPNFNGIESYFTMIKREYIFPLLQVLMRDEMLRHQLLIAQSNRQQKGMKLCIEWFEMHR